MTEAAAKKSPKALKKLLDDAAQAQMVGAEDNIVEALRVVASVAEEIEASAEAWFRKKPTKQQRFRYWLRTQATVQLLGGKSNWDWLKGGVGKRHEVKAGDTLSKIAKAYYGDPSRWDIIYFHNCRRIGDDPDNISPKMILEIP